MAGRDLFAEDQPPVGRNLFAVDEPALAPTTQPSPLAAVPDAVTPEAPAPQEPGLLDRLKGLIAERGEMGTDILIAEALGEQGPAETIGQLSGKVIAGTALDVSGELLSTGFGLAGDAVSAITPDFIEGPIVEGSTAALEWALESDIGQLGLEALRAGEATYEEFKAENPRAARNIESVFNIGLILAPATGAARAGSQIPSFTKQALRSIPESDELFKQATKKFTKVKQSGSLLDSDKFVDFMAEFENAFTKQIDPALHPKLTGTLNLLEKRIGDDLDAEDLLIVRRNIASVGRSLEPDERRLGNALLRGFDDFVEELPGNKEWIEARKLYTQGIKTELMEEALDKAGRAASGFENGLRVQFRKILDNKKNKSRFSKSERAAMERVADGDFTTNTLKKLGGFSFGSGVQRSPLTALAGVAAGAEVAGGAGAVLVPVAGRVSQGLAQARTKRAADVARALMAGVRPEVQRPALTATKRALGATLISGAEGAQTEQDVR